MQKPIANQLARGFSLIEVMVSIVILAFGVISMGGLQLASLRSAQSSTNFSIAATLSRDYSEMMRSNFTVSNNTSTVAGVNPYLFDTSVTSTYTVSPAVDCKTTVCSAAQMGTLHIADWAERVQAQLPGARAVVCRDSTPRNADGSYKWACDNAGTAVSIKIGWIDKRDKEERGTTTVAVTPLSPQLVMGGMTGYAE
jgi:type IV pilus assembly protein PilV